MIMSHLNNLPVIEQVNINFVKSQDNRAVAITLLVSFCVFILQKNR